MQFSIFQRVSSGGLLRAVGVGWLVGSDAGQARAADGAAVRLQLDRSAAHARPADPRPTALRPGRVPARATLGRHRGRTRPAQQAPARPAGGRLGAAQHRSRVHPQIARHHRRTWGGNVTSAGWQVTLCDPMWHVSSRSGVATLRTDLHLLLTYLFTYDKARRIFTYSQLHTFNGPFSGTTWVSGYQKGKTNLDFTEQETVSGSGISWARCKSAPSSRHITTPAPEHSVFTGRMLFPTPNQ